MSDGMGREPAYLSSHATNRYFIPNWGIIDTFSLTRALLNEYGEKVNGSLIHANRLAFSRTRGYLCIAAAPWRVMHQPSLHER